MIDVILLDMDGVLADFVSAAIGVCGLPLKHDEVDQWDFFLPYMTAEEFWQKIDAVPGFWSNVIQPYPWAPEIVALCKENAKQVVFASAPCNHPNSAEGKIRWLRRHFFMERDRNDYMLGPDKYLMAKPGRVLIDDNENNCVAFNTEGGHSVLFPQPWNLNDGMDPVKHVQKALEAAQTARQPETVLTEASRIHTDRGRNYGPPEEHFQRTVGQINALFAHKLKQPFEPHEWAQMMICDKNARLIQNPGHRDSWVDIPGYSNCGHLVQERLQ